jgi:hypothetical protein
MLTLIMNDDNFGPRLERAQASSDGDKTALSSPDWSQWLQYWNDADTLSGNLRKVEHWLQRASLRKST